jgi:PhnB protein
MATLNPYLSFQNNARDVMEFYQSVLGGSLDVVTFKDFPDMPHEASDDDLVMHAYLHTDDGIQLMASDTPAGVPYTAPAGVALSLEGSDEQTLTRQWNALADGGTVSMPLDTAPWGGRFGMLTDKFGVAWYITIDASDS